MFILINFNFQSRNSYLEKYFDPTGNLIDHLFARTQTLSRMIHLEYSKKKVTATNLFWTLYD